MMMMALAYWRSHYEWERLMSVQCDRFVKSIGAFSGVLHEVNDLVGMMMSLRRRRQMAAAV